MVDERKVCFYAMSLKGLAAVRAALQRFGPAPIAHVVGARDHGTLDDSFDQLKALAEANRIAFYERHAPLPAPAAYRVFVGWKWLAEHGDHGIVLHDSLLPRYRGFAPVVSALLNGDDEIGATALLAAESYDAGPIVAQRRRAVRYPIKIAEAMRLVDAMYAELVTDIVGKIIAGEALEATPQDETRVSYSLWRDEDDYWIDWKEDARVVRRMIDATGFPFLGAKTRLNGNEVCSVLDAEEVEDVHIARRDVGKVIFVQDGCPVVVCGRGLLRIKQLVRRDSGKSVLPLKRFRSRFAP